MGDRLSRRKVVGSCTSHQRTWPNTSTPAWSLQSPGAPPHDAAPAARRAVPEGVGNFSTRWVICKQRSGSYAVHTTCHPNLELRGNPFNDAATLWCVGWLAPRASFRRDEEGRLDREEEAREEYPIQKKMHKTSVYVSIPEP